MSEALHDFATRVEDDLLPTFCGDPARRYALDGFDKRSIKVTSQDARNFMRAIASNVVADTGGGRFRAAQSKAHEVIFWEGSRSKTPRRITLWMEPVITIASLALLHFEYRWPKHLLGMQSEKWEFDLTAFTPDNMRCEHIAGEVKKSASELATLLKNMMALQSEGAIDESTLTRIQRNAYRKCRGLLRRRAPLFWAVSPGAVSQLFSVSYPTAETLILNEISLERLEFPPSSL